MNIFEGPSAFTLPLSICVFCREELELPSRCRFLLDDTDSSLNTTAEEFAGDASEKVAAGHGSDTVVDATSAMSNCSLSAAAP